MKHRERWENRSKGDILGDISHNKTLKFPKGKKN